MKHAYLVHGWEGKPFGGFRAWLRDELVARGYDVTAPALPNPDEPQLESWLACLHDTLTHLDEDTVIVGHSLGGLATLHFLSRLPKDVTVGKVVLVTPVVDRIDRLSDAERAFVAPWFETSLDDQRVRSAAKEIIGIFSDNDHWIPQESSGVLEERFGARTIIVHGKGHYSDPTSAKKVPEILAQIISE